MRVLIADDDALSRRILEDSLRSWGYDVLITKNGWEAWEELQRDDAPQLVILDWVMPGMDGVDICKKVRTGDSKKYIYIILLTAKTGRKDIIKGLESGADDYIIKPFDPDELRYRLRIGERIIELEQRNMRLASTDYLTGLLNRRSFMESLEAEINRCEREKKPLGIIIADIDHFKEINDSYGHQAGDIVLQGFARNVTKACRLYDFIGRYGGEEFIICLPGADRQETAKIAERIRFTVERYKEFIPDKNVCISITASFGVASLDMNAQESVDQLISNADNALYRAKDGGRNRVEIY